MFYSRVYTNIKNNIILIYFLHYNTNNIKIKSNTILNDLLINIFFLIKMK